MARRATFADLLPRAGARPGGVGGEIPPIADLNRDFVRVVSEDPDVQDWLISCSEHDSTRGQYLTSLAMFLQWAGWTPSRLLEIKREALKQGEPRSAVEMKIIRFHEALRQAEYAGLGRAKILAATYSFIGSKGYPIPKKLIRFDMSTALEMRVPTQEEADIFIKYAHGMERKLLYTMMKESPCRPRVFPAIRWNWLERNWQNIEVAHVTLPKQFRPGGQGARKFEPICFFGPRTLELFKQVRQARLLQGQTPNETDRILASNYEAVLIVVRRDYERLSADGLIRPSRTDEAGALIEQPLTPKSWRKLQFNIIDALTNISPEWRKMLKGRDLQTERYYSHENIEALREIYRNQIYPLLWPNAGGMSSAEVQSLRSEMEELKLKLQALEAASGLRIKTQEVTA